MEADLEERRRPPSLPERREFLERAAGVRVSDSTVSRMLGRPGWSRKKDRWVRASATRVPEGRLAGSRGRRDRRGAAPGVRGRGGRQRLACLAVRLVTQGGAGLRERPAQLGEERHSAGEHDARGRGAVRDRGRRDHQRGLRGLPGAGARSEPLARAGCGDGRLSLHKGERGYASSSRGAAASSSTCRPTRRASTL